MIEIHQNNTEDLDQGQDRLSMETFIVAEIFVETEKDDDRCR